MGECLVSESRGMLVWVVFVWLVEWMSVSDPEVSNGFAVVTVAGLPLELGSIGSALAYRRGENWQDQTASVDDRRLKNLRNGGGCGVFVHSGYTNLWSILQRSDQRSGSSGRGASC